MNNPDFPDASAAIRPIRLSQENRTIRKIRIFRHIRFIRMNWMAPARRVDRVTDGPPEPPRSRPRLDSPPVVVAGALRGLSMRLHRQTNRRRVSDNFVRAILRERVRNGLPIDAETVRDLDIACGSDRLSRLRREVLLELDTEFAAARQKPDMHTGAAAVPRAVAWGPRAAPGRIITEPWAPERPRSVSVAGTPFPTARSGVVAVWAAMRRVLIGMVRRFAPKSSVNHSRVMSAARSREDNR